MIESLRMFRALLAAVFIFFIGNGLLGTLISTRMTLEGFSIEATGNVLSGYFLGLLVGSFICQHILRKVGHLRAFALFAICSASVAFLHGFYLSPLFWGILRFLCGLSSFGMFVTVESWLNGCTQKPLRNQLFSVYLILSYLGVSVGQQFINIGNVLGNELFILSGIVFAVCILPLSAAGKVYPQQNVLKTQRFFGLLRRAPQAMLGSMVAGLTTGSFYALMPVVCTDIRMTLANMSWIMTLTVLSGLTFQYLLSRMSNRVGPTVLLNGVTGAIAVFSAIMFMASNPAFWIFAFAMGLIGSLLFAVYPLSVAQARVRLADYDAVTVSNGLLYAYSIGASLSPLLASGTMSLLRNPFGLFAFWCVAHSAFVVIACILNSQAQMVQTTTAGIAFRNGTKSLMPAMADFRKRSKFQQARPT